MSDSDFLASFIVWIMTILLFLGAGHIIGITTEPQLSIYAIVSGLASVIPTYGIRWLYLNS